MKVFRGLCLAAAMALLVTCAFPQGRGHDPDKDKGGQSSGGSGKSGGSGGGGGYGGPSRGGGSGGGGYDRGGSRGDSGRGSGGTQGRGDGGRGNGGGNSGGSGSGSQGRGDGGRGDSGRGNGGPTVGGGSGGSGGGTQGRGDGGRGNGGPTVGGGSSGGSGGGTQGRGDGGRGNGGPTVGGGSGGSGGGTQGRGDGGRGNGGPTVGGGSGGSGGGTQGRGDGGRGDRGNGGPTVGGGNSGRGDGDVGRGRGDGGNGSGGYTGGGSSGTRGGGTRGGGTSGGTTRGSGGWGQDPSLGRPGRDDQLGRKNSHSGTTHYGGNSNVASVTRVGGTIVIGRAPRNLADITKRDDIRRKDHPGLVYGGYRSGYYFYNTFWCDDYFWYPFYRFDPWGDRCCVSPWYYYSMLPPYVAWNRCRFYNLVAWDAWVGDPYQWQRPNYYGNYDNWGHGRASEIDYAVDDIVSAFERADRRAAGRLISSDSDVAIYVDGKYSYTLNADDFYDMFLDATQNTKTRRYQILHVDTGHDERNHDCIRVTARHEYEDAWGAATSVTHFYELHYEGANLVIGKFGVSQ